MLAADASMVILRVVHIVTGVVWVGSLFVVVVFVQPSAAALGSAGAPFMSELRRRRSLDVVFIDALFTIAAGSFLYWHDLHTYPSFGDWIGSNFGAALTVGALLAISDIPHDSDGLTLDPSRTKNPSRTSPFPARGAVLLASFPPAF